MNNINLEIENKHNIGCVVNKNGNYDLIINKKIEEGKTEIVSLELEKIDIVNLINGILKVYSFALKNNKDTFLYDIVKGKISLEYDSNNDISNIRISSDMATRLDMYKVIYLKLTNNDLLSLSIMLSSTLTK